MIPVLVEFKKGFHSKTSRMAKGLHKQRARSGDARSCVNCFIQA
jgi:hypothetical protein